MENFKMSYVDLIGNTHLLHVEEAEDCFISTWPEFPELVTYTYKHEAQEEHARLMCKEEFVGHMKEHYLQVNFLH